MSYQQVRRFDQTKAGRVIGLCLRNVRLGYGIASKYNSAWQSWLNAPQKTTTIPTGLDIPVYFSYIATINGVRANYGHIGVRLANGRFWSDGKTFLNLTTFRALHWNTRYVGWSDEVNDVKVIKASTTTPVYHTVKAGETVTSICAKYGITLTKFKQLNPTITDINKIYVGQKVRVK